MTMKGHKLGRCMERTRELGVHAGISMGIWQFHYLFFGIIFAILSFFVLVSLLGLVKDDRQKKVRFSIEMTIPQANKTLKTTSPSKPLEKFIPKQKSSRPQANPKESRFSQTENPKYWKHRKYNVMMN